MYTPSAKNTLNLANIAKTIMVLLTGVLTWYIGNTETANTLLTQL